jgi:hypothetical protein
MKRLFCSLICLVAGLSFVAVFAYAQTAFLRADSQPKIHVQNVIIPQRASDPLLVTFKIISTGKTPVAIAQENIGFELWRPGIYSRKGGDLLFSNSVPRVVVVQPGSNVVINAMILTNAQNEAWSVLGPGKYGLQISTGSGKTQNFDYEWMGQLHSDSYEFEVKSFQN